MTSADGVDGGAVPAAIASGSQTTTLRDRSHVVGGGARARSPRMPVKRVDPLPATLVDLFCGAGGMTLGFQQAGFKPIFAVDNDVDAMNTHRANFIGDSVCADIRAIEDFPSCGVVVGGPPCQGFSLLGKKARKDRVENFLWREYMR